MKTVQQAYDGDVAIILTNALNELAQDKQFDADLLAHLRACFAAGTLGDERQLQKHLETLIQEARP